MLVLYLEENLIIKMIFNVGDMMKRLFLLLFIVLLTGCSASYNLEVNDSFKESVVVTESNESNFDYVFSGFNMKEYNNFYLTKEFPYYYDDPYMPDINYRFDDVSYYDVKDLSDYGKIGLSMSANIDDVNDFSKSNLLWKTCRVKDISLKDGVLKINVSGFKSFDEYKILGTVNVNINSKYKVLSNNADKVYDGGYTWKITRDNYNDKTINISFKTDSILDDVADKTQDPMVRFTIVIGILCFIGFLIYVFVKRVSIIKNRF